MIIIFFKGDITIMKKNLTVLFLILSVIVLGFTACSPSKTTEAAVTTPVAAPAVSDGSEDLIIDYSVNVAGSDEGNFFHWKGNVRYMAADDNFDATSGASTLGSTHLFMMYLYDVEGKETMSSGLRGLFLYGVNGAASTKGDNVQASKASDGAVTIQYVHRGTAFRFTTDKSGVLSLPDGMMESRKIGTPKEIEAAFTSDGTAAGVDYAKVWSSDVKPAGANPESMYFWDGDLKIALTGDIMTISGVLTSVAR